MTQLKLTDSEWMSLIDGSDERAGNLAKCCANISHLRDCLISIARDGGEVESWNESGLREALGWVKDSHELHGIPALIKVCAQLDMPLRDLEHAPSTTPEGL